VAGLAVTSGAHWQNREVLVTGATGFLGTWMTHELLRRGARVVALVRDWNGASNFARMGLDKQVTVAHGDLVEPHLVERVMARYGIQTVIHLAAEAIVGAAQKSAASTFVSNIQGTWVLLEACKTVGVEACVVASSDKAYGHHEELPYTESFALKPMFPYETSKACADMITQCYAHSYGVRTAVTRCGNIYGGGDVNWSRIVPGTIKSALQNERPIIRSDGTFIRDYIYVDDIVAGYLSLAEHLGGPSGKEIAGQAFNFGTATPVSVLELTHKIIALTGKSLTPEILGKRRELKEILEQHVGSQKAAQILGWKPKHSLEDGLKKSIAWYEPYLRNQEHAERHA
jgi:CDP-glucose 4,6-dehydratase